MAAFDAVFTAVPTSVNKVRPAMLPMVTKYHRHQFNYSAAATGRDAFFFLFFFLLSFFLSETTLLDVC